MLLLLLGPKVMSLKSLHIYFPLGYHLLWMLTFHISLLYGYDLEAIFLGLDYTEFVLECAKELSYICHVLNTNTGRGLKIWGKLMSGPAFTSCLFAPLRVLGELLSPDSTLTFRQSLPAPTEGYPFKVSSWSDYYLVKTKSRQMESFRAHVNLCTSNINPSCLFLIEGKIVQ